MLKLSEYRNKTDRLADHLPWAALVAPGVVLNKDGSFQRSFRFRGPDLESATESELVAACARVNNVLRRLGSGWALFFEAERYSAPGYPQSEFPDFASWLVDEERRAQFEDGTQPRADGMRTASREHYENAYTLTLIYMAPADQVARAERALIETDGDGEGRDWRYELAGFVAETNRTLDLLGQIMPEIAPLDDGETLTYLHRTVSTKRHSVHAPDQPIYLDAILADQPLAGGLEPKLGTKHLRTLTILGFPNATRPGLLDALNHLDFPYRWMTRFIALDKTEATKTLTKLRRQWFNKRKSITQLVREVMYSEPVQLLDSDADNKVVDSDAALQALGGDHVAFGYLTTTVTVFDEDRMRVEEKVRAVERAVNGLGFTTIRESLNAVEAWLGSLPGHVYANVRQPLIHTLNLAHLMPLSSVWAGPKRNEHLNGPPLLVAETSGSTPFRFSTHVGDVGHTLIVGPTGAGKSVLLALIAMQFRRYPESQLYTFDKGNSARAAILAMGGAHHELGSDGSLAFQPLRGIDEPTNHGGGREHRDIAEFFTQRQHLVGVEAAGFRNNMPRAHADVDEVIQPGTVRHRRGVDRGIVRRDGIDVCQITQRRRHQIAVAQHHALRAAGSARGVEQPRQIVVLARQRHGHALAAARCQVVVAIHRQRPHRRRKVAGRFRQGGCGIVGYKG